MEEWLLDFSILTLVSQPWTIDHPLAFNSKKFDHRAVRHTKEAAEFFQQARESANRRVLAYAIDSFLEIY